MPQGLREAISLSELVKKGTPGLEITAVEPDQPLEGERVRVSYSLMAPYFKATKGGQLTAYYAVDGSSSVLPAVTVDVPALGPAETREGYILLTAPRAGSYTIELIYAEYPDQPTGETPAPVTQAHASVAAPVAAIFYALLESIQVHHTHSPHEDTVYVHLAATTSDGDTSEAKLSLGDINDGHYQTDLAVGPFRIVPGVPGNFLSITYAVINAGYDASGEKNVEAFWNGVSKGSKEVASAYFPLLSGAWDVGDKLMQVIHGVFFTDCDCVLAAETVLRSGSDLAAFTAKDDYYAWTGQHTTATQLGCRPGGSAYDVRYAIQRRGKGYRIEVRTSDVEDAGTDANVFVVLKGDRGSSREFELDNREDNFERGKTDRFAVVVADIGELEAIQLRHDNSGNKPGWYVDQVVISDDQAGRTWVVPVNRWLDKEHGIGADFPVRM